MPCSPLPRGTSANVKREHARGTAKSASPGLEAAGSDHDAGRVGDGDLSTPRGCRSTRASADAEPPPPRGRAPGRPRWPRRRARGVRRNSTGAASSSDQPVGSEREQPLAGRNHLAISQLGDEAGWWVPGGGPGVLFDALDEPFEVDDLVVRAAEGGGEVDEQDAFVLCVDLAVPRLVGGFVDAVRVAVQRHAGGAAEDQGRLSGGEEDPLPKADGIPASDDVVLAVQPLGQWVALCGGKVPAGVEAVIEGRTAAFVHLTQHLGLRHWAEGSSSLTAGLPPLPVVKAVGERLLGVVLVAARGRTAPSVSGGLDLANTGVAAVAADRGLRAGGGFRPCVGIQRVGGVLGEVFAWR